MGDAVAGGSIIVGGGVCCCRVSLSAAATVFELGEEVMRWGSFSREEPLPNNLLVLRVAERVARDDELGVESSDSALEE